VASPPLRSAADSHAPRCRESASCIDAVAPRGEPMSKTSAASMAAAADDDDDDDDATAVEEEPSAPPPPPPPPPLVVVVRGSRKKGHRIETWCCIAGIVNAYCARALCGGSSRSTGSANCQKKAAAGGGMSTHSEGQEHLQGCGVEAPAQTGSGR